MDYCLSRSTVLFPHLQITSSYHAHDCFPRSTTLASSKSRSSSLVVVASAEAISSLNTPLEPRSLPGKFLSGVLQNQRQLFHVAVAEQLRDLADDRDAALARMNLSYGSSSSSESCLHRWFFIFLFLATKRVLFRSVGFLLNFFNFFFGCDGFEG